MPKIGKIEQILKMDGQLDSCTCSPDIESLFDFYAQYELDQVDHTSTVFV